MQSKQRTPLPDLERDVARVLIASGGMLEIDLLELVPELGNDQRGRLPEMGVEQLVDLVPCVQIAVRGRRYPHDCNACENAEQQAPFQRIGRAVAIHSARAASGSPRRAPYGSAVAQVF